MRARALLNLSGAVGAVSAAIAALPASSAAEIKRLLKLAFMPTPMGTIERFIFGAVVCARKRLQSQRSAAALVPVAFARGCGPCSGCSVCDDAA